MPRFSAAVSPRSSTKGNREQQATGTASTSALPTSSSATQIQHQPFYSAPESPRRSSSPSSFASTHSTQPRYYPDDQVETPVPSGSGSAFPPGASATHHGYSQEEDEFFVACHPPSVPASFTFVCLGVGGGPLESDCSCYVVKAADRTWRQGMYVLEGGSWLGALSKVCSDSLRRAFYDFDFSHDDPSLRAGEIGSFAKAFLISHAHLDHILGMVLGSASLPGKRAVYGLKSTLNNLMGMFDGKLWPKLASFKEDEPFIVYHLKPVESQSPIVLDDSLTVLPFALSHGLIASSVPAPPTPTPLPSRSSYFSKRYSLPLSSLVPLATGGAVRQLASSKDRPFGEKPVFTSPFAPDRNVQAYQEGSGGSDVAPDSHDGGRDKADQYAVAQSHTAKAPLPLRDLAAARRPKTASGSERAVGTPPASAPAGPTIDESGHNTPSSPPPVPPKAGSRMSDRRAAAPRRVSIDHGNTQAALDSTAFFLTNKRTGHDVLFFGDVEPDCVSRSPRNKRVWQHTASRFAVGKLHLMFLECSFPAAHPTEFLWGHLSVNHLYDELTVLARCVKSERAVLTRRSNLAAGTLRPNGLSGMTAVNQTRSAAGGVAMGASSSSSGAMGSLVPPSPLSAPGSAELKGTLQGLTVVVIHVKQALFPSYAATSGGEGGEQGAERVLDPRSMQERILQELNELEEENELGVRFVIAKQGMRIET